MPGYPLPIQRKLFFLLLCLAITSSLLAQTTVSDQLWILHNQPAKVTYDYILEQEDTILQGNFDIQTTDLLALLSDQDAHFSARGPYDNNQPNGNWRIELGTFESSSAPQLLDYQYQVLIDGITQIATGPFQEGQLQGKWSIETREINHSKLGAVQFRSEQEFKDDKATKSLKIETPNTTLIGRFKRNALAHDTWILYEDLDPIEYWIFQNGTLSQIIQHNPFSEDTINVWNPHSSIYPMASDDMITAQMDSKYFEVIKWWLKIQQTNTDLIQQSQLATLTLQHVEQYQQFAAKCQDLPGMRFYPFFGVKLPQYKLTRKETKQLNQISQQLQHIDTLVQLHLQNTALVILENTDASIGEKMDRVRQMDKITLSPFRQLIQHYKQGLLPHLPRSTYYPHLWSKDVALKTNVDQIKKDGLKAIVQIIEEELLEMQKLELQFAEKLNTKQRQKVLTALEEELLMSITQLDSLINSQDRRFIKRSGLKSIKEAILREQEQYSRIQQVTERQIAVRSFITCVEEMNALAITLIKLPKQQQAIQELYTDPVWNNFTATVMDDEIKKRITDAYENHLLPYFDAQIQTGLDCAKAMRINKQLQTLHERMMAMRDEHTEDIEDQLKDLHDPEQILRLFNRSLQ